MASNSFKVKNSLVLTPKDLSTLTNPEAGDLACDINDSNKIKRYDENAASWVEVGSGGGVGGVDIFFVQDFESASLSSFDSQVGLSLSQTDPLKGRVSALLTHDSSVDQLFKQVIPVDAKFRGIPMVLRLDSKSSASQGNLVINIYDETNSQDIVASEQLQLSDEVSGKKTSVSFTIPESCESLSYTITALPEAGSPVSRIDDIICEIAASSLLETAVEVPVVTAWQSYTPTFQGFGNPTSIEFHWRQVGEDVEIRGKFTSGTATTDEARVSLPSGSISADTSKIPSIQQVGEAASTAGATGDYTVLIEPSVAYISFGYQSGTASGLEKTVGSNLVVNGQSLSFFASVPCTGLSATTTKTIPLTQSGLIQEADSSVRVQGGNGAGSTLTSVRRFLNIQENFGDDITYLSSPTNGDSFTINSSGIYHISYSEQWSSAGAVGVFKNQSSFTSGANSLIIMSGDASNNIDYNTQATDVYLKEGDVIRALTVNPAIISSNSAYAQLTITKQGSLKQVNINPESKITIPTSELRMEGASSRGSTATAIVRFDNIAKIRGDAFEVVSNSVDGTYVRMKKAGKLAVSTSIYQTSGYIAISKNQSNLAGSPSASETLIASGSSAVGAGTRPATWVGNVFIGDIIRIFSSIVPATANDNTLNLSFQEQDISVSVSNVLPQFSEGDSSVRVDTANGYGSVGTKIRRFSNVRDNLGNDIQYVPSATNGDSFVVQSDGIYHISYSDNFNNLEAFGITKNADGAVGVLSLPLVNVLSRSTVSDVGFAYNTSWQGFLESGDVIKAQTNSAFPASNNSLASLTISKVGKPNITSVDVTPFTNIAFDKGSVGEIKAFAGPVDSVSFLECDGRAVSRTVYLELFNRIGTTHGEGDGSSTFNLPDYRGRFLRGVDGTAGRDPDKASRTAMNSGGAVGNNVGSVQTDAFQGHDHDTAVATVDSFNGAGTRLVNGSDAGTTRIFSVSGPTENGSFGSPRVANETRPQNAYVNYGIRFKAANDAILTPSDTFSTDTAPLNYAPSSQYTLSTLESAPVGTFITFTYAANTNTRTQTTTAPTQSTADMNQNGIRIFTRAFNAASTAASPAAVAIQIGKGMKGISKNMYASLGKILPLSMDAVVRDANVEYGVKVKEYDEKSGVLLIDAGQLFLGTNTLHRLAGYNGSDNTSGYLTINAGKTLPLLAIPTPKVAYLKDVKPSGTGGGTFTAGAWRTRTLNTIEGDGSFVSLNANQWTLPAGKYEIEASAIASKVDLHQIKIRNITDSTDAIFGITSFAQDTQDAVTTSSLTGIVNLTSSKVFELQHRCSTTKATDGFGVPASFGSSEVYAMLKIKKLS